MEAGNREQGTGNRKEGFQCVLSSVWLTPRYAIKNQIGVLYIALTQDLAALLGRKVDVAEPQNLHDLIKDKVLSESVPL
ncbi:hypothetical protein [Sphaerospermopsis aphanizomenoides]|uniref:hypothetical protein n=1 Tax=Sphaerospermopsis aphanizomenoides TaxID=459663 RepID=UPI000B29CDDD|nr:hypothetical protein [Sphaerospermopsis aphanizomenoides]